MALYTVTWTIQVEASSPEQAALKARHYQRPGSTAVCFDVIDETGESISVDLWDIAEELED